LDKAAVLRIFGVCGHTHHPPTMVVMGGGRLIQKPKILGTAAFVQISFQSLPFHFTINDLKTWL